MKQDYKSYATSWVWQWRRCQQVYIKLCPFQTNTSQHLTQHINVKHKSGYSCRSCDTYLESKSELDKHIVKHHKSYKPCRSFENNSCEYDKCRYNHVILKGNERICHKCGDKVKNQTDFKKHIQDTHQDIVCKKFLENNCTFGTKCMFPHKTRRGRPRW